MWAGRLWRMVTPDLCPAVTVGRSVTTIFYAMPTVLRVDGYRFYFFSREGQEPPHIHVEQAERYAKFWLSPVSLAATRGFRSHELGRLSQLVLEHRTFFEEQWYGHLRNQG